MYSNQDEGWGSGGEHGNGYGPGNGKNDGNASGNFDGIIKDRGNQIPFGVDMNILKINDWQELTERDLERTGGGECLMYIQIIQTDTDWCKSRQQKFYKDWMIL